MRIIASCWVIGICLVSSAEARPHDINAYEAMLIRQYIPSEPSKQAEVAAPRETKVSTVICKTLGAAKNAFFTRILVVRAQRTIDIVNMRYGRHMCRLHFHSRPLISIFKESRFFGTQWMVVFYRVHSYRLRTMYQWELLELPMPPLGIIQYNP